MIVGIWRSVVNAGMRRGQDKKSDLHMKRKKEGEEEATIFQPCQTSATNYICHRYHRCDRNYHARVVMITTPINVKTKQK